LADHDNNGSVYRWYMLILSGATATLAVAAPSMAMPVLFSEIAEDLRLSLVQVGAIWGMVSFAGLFAGLAGGIIGDRFGTKRTLAVACLLIGLAGASRGLSNGLAAMTVTVFLTGLVAAAIPMEPTQGLCRLVLGKETRHSQRRHLGRDGTRLHWIGSLISATVLSSLARKLEECPVFVWQHRRSDEHPVGSHAGSLHMKGSGWLVAAPDHRSDECCPTWARLRDVWIPRHCPARRRRRRSGTTWISATLLEGD